MLNMLISLSWSFVALVESQHLLPVGADGIPTQTFCVGEVRVTVRLLSALFSTIEVRACPQAVAEGPPTFAIVPASGLTGPTLRVWSSNPDPDACIALALDALHTLFVRFQGGK